MKLLYGFLIFFILIHTSSYGQIADSFTDSRDGQTYKTIKIGQQVWMAENLAYELSFGCWAYSYDESYVETYGRLYNWEAAMLACPSGWHLPRDAEWKILENYLKQNDIPGGALKADTLWKNTNEAIKDSIGFDALPAGCRYISEYGGGFKDLGRKTFFWSASTYKSVYAWERSLHTEDEQLHFSVFEIKNGYSVRCVQD